MQKYFVKGVVFFIFPICLLLCLSSSVYGQCDDQTIFERISVEHGLSQGTVNSFCQDYKGFLWIGTNSGLNRYDGVNFSHFIFNSNDTTSISSNIITTVFEDSKQRLWVGTKDEGLNFFDRETETFTRVRINPKASNSTAQNKIVSINEDLQGNLWVVFVGGINKFVTESNEFVTYINTDSYPNIIPSNLILDLEISDKGDVFISTAKGVAYYSAKEDSFKSLNITSQPHHASQNSMINSIVVDLSDNIWFGLSGKGLFKYNPKSEVTEWYGDAVQSADIYDLCKTANGDIWIGTADGVYRYDWKTREFCTFQNGQYNPNSLTNNGINSIFEDRQGIVWMGVNGLGINKYNPHKTSFFETTSLSDKLADFSAFTAKSFYEDGDDIWIGTYGEGVIKVNYSNSNIFQLKHIAGDESSLPDDNVYQITKTPDDIMWFATSNGLGSYDPKNRTIKNYRSNSEDSRSLPLNVISGLLVDSKGDLWYSTFMDYFGKLNSGDDSFQNYSILELDTTVTQGISSITDFYEDANGIFWIGTNGKGIYLFDPVKEAFIAHFVADHYNDKSICSNRVHCFYEDSHNNIWIGTSNGLSLFNAHSFTFTNIQKHHGLPNCSVAGVQQDDDGYYWISTLNGLSRADLTDIENPVFRNFNTYDAIGNNAFIERASFKDRRGYLYFSGYNNLNIFNPEAVFENSTSPQVYINKVSVSKKNILNSKHQNSHQYIERDSVLFPLSCNNFIFDYTAIEFYQPHKVRFRYMLEGFDNEWIDPIDHKQRYVNYTNLNPGTYTFKVIAANSDGVWNYEGDSFHFTISPPLWKKWWFISFISLLFASFTLIFVKYREASLVRSKNKLEELVKNRTTEISNQSEELKMQSEYLQKANEEILETSEAHALQNEKLQQKNEVITIKNKELEEQKNSLANLAWELQDKNVAITAQRNEIERQKKEITDSILYAFRIQQAVLPSQEQVKDLFPDFFIFNRPKSIVSGDFYWTARIGNYRVVAVVDCTGHGVPGGFMSMLGVLMLNEVVVMRGVLDPAKALNQLRQGIISVLHQTGEFTDSADGMDLSLCVINDFDNTLTYSGANSSMILFEPSPSPDQESLTLIRSDRMPIAFHPIMKSFSNKKFALTDNSVLFLFTDGIVDQFGGARNKKFQNQRFIDFIQENKNLPLETQGIVLEQTFDAWKGATYQVDDVMVMGLKV